MTPQRATDFVTRWVRIYTRGLPTPVARRRVEEIGADLHDHVTYERGQGASDRRIAFSVLTRMVCGMAADASWRQKSRRKGTPVKSFLAILVTALGFAALGVVAIMEGETADAPELILFGILVIVGAFALGVRTAQRSGGTYNRR